MISTLVSAQFTLKVGGFGLVPFTTACTVNIFSTFVGNPTLFPTVQDP